MTSQTTGAAVLAVLRDYDLKAEHSGAYRANSPFRPGSNSHALSLVIKPDGEHGAWHDHVSGESGSLYDLASRLNIPIGKAEAASSSKRAYSGIADYAAEHGITAEVLAAAGWEETTHHGRPALRFTTATGARYRYLDNAKPTYQSPAGYQACWYGLTRAIALAQQTQSPLVLCNGEMSTVVAQHYGLPAACATGSGEKCLSDKLLAELRLLWDGPIVIALDSDTKGRLAAPKLESQLRAAGYPARAVDLGGSFGFDLADYCHLHGEHAVRLLAQPSRTGESDGSELRAASQRFQLYPLHELRGLPPVSWLILHEIPAGLFTVICGQSGAGKSFLALDYALRAAIANPEKAVIYVAAEGSGGIYARAAAWLSHHQIAEYPTNIYFIIRALPVLDATAVAELCALVTPLSPSLIVLDTLARSMVGGDENSAKDMGLFVAGCDSIREQTRAAVAVLHHTGKAGTGYRGSSALYAAADSWIDVTNDDGLITVSCGKAKDWEPFSPRYLRLVTVGESCVILPAEQVSQRDAELTEAQRKVLETLALEIFRGPGAKRSELTSATSISDVTMFRILSRLKKLDYISQAKKGDPYFISDEGMEAIRAYHRNRREEQAAQATITPVSGIATPNYHNYQTTINELSESDQPTITTITPLIGVIVDSSGDSSEEVDSWDAFWKPVPLTRQLVLRVYLRSEQEKDQARARELCDEYGIDYDTAYQLARPH